MGGKEGMPRGRKVEGNIKTGILRGEMEAREGEGGRGKDHWRKKFKEGRIVCMNSGIYIKKSV